MAEKKLDGHQLEEIKIAYAMGVSPQDLAKTYGVTAGSIHYYYRAFKLAGLPKYSVEERIAMEFNTRMRRAA